MQNLRIVCQPGTADEKYYLLNRGNLQQHFQMQLSQKRKIFSPVFLNFWNLDSTFEYFQKKMTLIADAFLSLGTPKNVVRLIFKKSFFRGSFDKWHLKRIEKLLKSERQRLYHIYWSLWKQFSWKKSLLMIWKILGVLFNPLTADDKYSLLNRDNL